MTDAVDVALATCRRLPEPDLDDRPLRRALAEVGIATATWAWDEPRRRFAGARMTLLRSTWNYPQSPARFLAWARRTAAESELQNPLAAVEWNLHKRYLLELERDGVAIAPTELVRRGSRVGLEPLVCRRGWSEVVVKPAISAASYRTRRIGPGELASGAAHLAELLASGDALVQRYLPAVETYGERSLVWIDGAVTHAVRKRPRFAGDAEAVSAGAVEIRPEERRLAEAAVARARELCRAPLLYARADLAPAPSGEPFLMELELIEPSLFFDQSGEALARFTRAVAARLGR